jgi:glucokinase
MWPAGPQKDRAMLLAGDIGGTKTRLAIYSPASGPRTPVVEEVFPSARYPNLEGVVREFLAKVRHSVDRACFDVAGPVVDGRATVTNLPWVVDERTLRQELGLSTVRVLNDLVATARAVPLLGSGDVVTLNAGTPAERGAIAVIAPGTGLGEAYLTWNGTRYRPHPSEGGHADFAPTTQEQLRLSEYLQSRLEHVSYERVCSGIGLPHLYAFLKDTGSAPEPSWLRDELATAPDPAPVIVEAALSRERPCELCARALHAFVSILGAEAGNMALKVLATGGVYLAGGIPPRIVPALRDGDFMQAFTRKGRMSALLARMPVHVIVTPDVALLGAASEGLEL